MKIGTCATVKYEMKYSISRMTFGGQYLNMLADKTIDIKHYNEIPLRVAYFLTPKGPSALPMLHFICQWSATYLKADEEKAEPP